MNADGKMSRGVAWIQEHPLHAAAVCSILSFVLLVAIKVLKAKYNIELKDTVDLFLVAIMFLPVLVIVLNVKEAKLPGGLELTFNEIKREQKAQKDQLDEVKKIAVNLMGAAVVSMLKPEASASPGSEEANAVQRTGDAGGYTASNEAHLDKFKKVGLLTVQQALHEAMSGKDKKDLSLTDIGKLFLENYEKEDTAKKE